MTTERSGMSLESVRDLLRTEEIFYAERGTSTFLDYKAMAAAIDAHLSRDAVVSADDVDGLHQMACEYGDTDDAGTGYDFSMEQFDEFAKAVVSSFAARHAAVPDAMVVKLDEGTVMGEYSSNGDIVTGWNACRKAMLAQRDGVACAEVSQAILTLTMLTQKESHEPRQDRRAAQGVPVLWERFHRFWMCECARDDANLFRLLH